VVKLIDVYPPQYPMQPELGGYELPIGIDIFRGRYRTSFEHPSPIPANKAQRYRFTLPNRSGGAQIIEQGRLLRRFPDE